MVPGSNVSVIVSGISMMNLHEPGVVPEGKTISVTGLVLLYKICPGFGGLLSESQYSIVVPV
jgi:hypothetical protein